MKHIYLCGPFSGRPLTEAVVHFFTVEQEIRRKANADTIPIHTSNPTRFCPPDLEWDKAMRICVGEMVRCGGIALLQGWEQSRGATLELKLANDLRIPVVCIEPPVEYDYLTRIFMAAPEIMRYYNACLSRFQQEGVEEPLAEDRAVAELTNRYLDPYGFEYIDISEGDQYAV